MFVFACPVVSLSYPNIQPLLFPVRLGTALHLLSFPALVEGFTGRFNTLISSRPWAEAVLVGTLFFPLNLLYSDCHSLTAQCREHAVIPKPISLIPSL